MNDRILLALKAKPRELLFGRSFTPENTTPTNLQPTAASDADIHFALADSLRWNAHLLSLQRAEQQKSSFDANAKIVEIILLLNGTHRQSLNVTCLSTSTTRGRVFVDKRCVPQTPPRSL
ncbi:hypothetical protein B0H10DRAFT_2096661 [Mycena sp. CBHHK59/15]|nr:hypothetical protein B0H10DRAFT_2096661 [Mycena sp. CBHHK59/15]